ncbi:MAG: autotransporter-associated beta strand repeat-containing protein [Opitutaceae bacterium]
MLVSTPAPGAPNFALAPGVVISYQASPSSLDQLFGNDVYIADPDIVVLPNGNYIASHSYFGSGSTEDTAAITRVFRSTDKGATWTFLIQFQPLWRASLFVYEGSLYIIGSAYNGSSYMTVRKSTDNGSTWTTPTDANSGRFESVPLAGTMGTPNNPLIFNNRLFAGGGTRSTFSTPITTTDPLVITDWRQSGSVQTFPTWQVGLAGPLGTAFIGESQVVASPDTGVVVMGKVEGLPYTALMRGERSVGNMRFGPSNDFAAMPGGEKKFGAAFDPVSGKFFVLSNPVLPFHASDTSLTPQLKRNTAAVLSSRDLVNWEVEKIFLYSPNISYEGWQYLQFDFDGDDLVVASRTAFDVGDTNKPPRGHDSNLLTFHRLPNFRTHTRNHYLLADTANNRVLRYEVNQNPNHPAPLGDFTLGTSFAGAPLSVPRDLAQDANGDVYIHEDGGRILRFDPLGNFIAIAPSSPVAFTPSQLPIAQPATGERSWVQPGSGNWSDPLNWYYWGRPDTTAEVANFGSSITTNATITVDAAPLRWLFDTDGDEEGWTLSNITGSTVTGGVFAGTSSTASPRLNRDALSFPGSISPEVRVRMKASGPGTSVDFYWGTTVADSITSARKVTVAYTGAGAFQDIVIPMAGNAAWDGKIITRCRIDLPKDSGATFEVDSIQIPQDSFRIKGVRFRSTRAYSLTGSGSLQLAPESGNGVIDVQLGGHTVAIPVSLLTTTDCAISAEASLNITGPVTGPGSMIKTGAGTLTLNGANSFTGGIALTDGVLQLTGTLTGDVVVNGGTLNANGTINHNLTILGGSLRITVNGTTPGTQYDQLNLTGSSGSVTLSGTLDLIAAPGLATGSTFTLINNSGNSTPVNGTFSGLPQNTEFYEDGQWWRITYTGGTGNDVVLTRIAPTPWQTWKSAHFTTETNTPGIAEDTADPDADGLVNLLEYALGGNPLSPLDPPLSISSLDAGKLTLTFIRTLTNTDITLTVQAAETPSGPWTELATSVHGSPFSAAAGSVTETGSGTTRTVVASDQYPTSTPDHPRRFMRLQITR